MQLLPPDNACNAGISYLGSLLCLIAVIDSHPRMGLSQHLLRSPLYSGTVSVLTDIKQNLSVLGVRFNLYNYSHPEVTCLAEARCLDYHQSTGMDICR